MKSILILKSSEKIGTPAFERVNSFINFFKDNGFHVLTFSYPLNLISFLKLVNFIFKNKINYLFVSQPPFKFFIIFLIPFVKKIIDYRDGWSIANLHGYGGLKKPNFIKYYLSRYIEKLCMRKSCLIITCTEGLVDYLFQSSGKKVLLITNGISQSKYNLIKAKLRINKNFTKKNIMKFACAGQFSEYGVNHVKKILKTISKRYYSYSCEINLFGCDINKNIWINDFLKNNNLNIKIIFHDRLHQEELYSKLSNFDCFICVIRDPSFDFGTKVFEYIAFEKPILNYFSEDNNFVYYFNGVFDLNRGQARFDKEIIRENILKNNSINILESL